MARQQLHAALLALFLATAFAASIDSHTESAESDSWESDSWESDSWESDSWESDSHEETLHDLYARAKQQLNAEVSRKEQREILEAGLELDVGLNASSKGLDVELDSSLKGGKAGSSFGRRNSSLLSGLGSSYKGGLEVDVSLDASRKGGERRSSSYKGGLEIDVGSKGKKGASSKGGLELDLELDSSKGISSSWRRGGKASDDKKDDLKSKKDDLKSKKDDLKSKKDDRKSKKDDRKSKKDGDEPKSGLRSRAQEARERLRSRLDAQYEEPSKRRKPSGFSIEAEGSLSSGGRRRNGSLSASESTMRRGESFLDRMRSDISAPSSSSSSSSSGRGRVDGLRRRLSGGRRGGAASGSSGVGFQIGGLSVSADLNATASANSSSLLGNALQAGVDATLRGADLAVGLAQRGLDLGGRVAGGLAARRREGGDRARSLVRAATNAAHGAVDMAAGVAEAGMAVPGRVLDGLGSVAARAASRGRARLDAVRAATDAAGSRQRGRNPLNLLGVSGDASLNLQGPLGSLSLSYGQ